MNNLKLFISNYLEYCKTQKRLDEKTLKAYLIDLKQFSELTSCEEITLITPETLETHITQLHQQYKPKTVKRKIASLKAFFHYLEYKDIIEYNPFNKIQVRFREPVILPKTIPLHTIEAFLSIIYRQCHHAKTAYQKRNALRNAAVIHILEEYKNNYHSEIQNCNHFFANQSGNALSDQSVRRMINKYTSLAAIDLHITPHMFRHTFATCLLEADVDIRYIQEMLGHSSINITQIYTHVAVAKQKDILTTKHPRKDMHL